MFWENYVALCSKKGVAPNAVAAELRKSSGSVTAWKNGTIPRETTLKKIADYFEVSVDTLLYGQKEKPAPIAESELDNNIIKMLVSLTPEEFKQVDAFVQGLIAARKV